MMGWEEASSLRADAPISFVGAGGGDAGGLVGIGVMGITGIGGGVGARVMGIIGVAGAGSRDCGVEAGMGV